MSDTERILADLGAIGTALQSRNNCIDPCGFDKNGCPQIYRKDAKCCIHVAAGISGILLVFSLGLAAMVVLCKFLDVCVCPLNTLLIGHVILTAIWAVGAPIWFWHEFWNLYWKHGFHDGKNFERFKYQQQLSAAIWAGAIVINGAVLTAALARLLRLTPATDAAVCLGCQPWRG